MACRQMVRTSPTQRFAPTSFALPSAPAASHSCTRYRSQILKIRSVFLLLGWTSIKDTGIPIDISSTRAVALRPKEVSRAHHRGYERGARESVLQDKNARDTCHGSLGQQSRDTTSRIEPPGCGEANGG